MKLFEESDDFSLSPHLDVTDWVSVSSEVLGASTGPSGRLDWSFRQSPSMSGISEPVALSAAESSFEWLE